MADNKQKPNENPQGQPQGVPDVLKLGEVKQPLKAPAIAAEKTDVKKDTTKGAAEIKREMLQMEVNPDKDTPSKIERLDVDKGLETKEQKEGFELLQTVTATTLLAMLFEQGIKKEALQTIESMGSIGGNMLAKLNPAERVSLKKLQEIGAKPGSTLYGALKERWNRLVSRSHEIYMGAKKAKDSLSAPSKGPAGAPTAPEEPKTFWGKIGSFAKEHPILTAGIAAAGAYGVYKIFKWFTSDKDEESSEEKKEGFLDKILGNKWATRLKWGLGVSAGIFVLGRLIGNEDIGRWLKDKLGIDITGNRLSQFIVLLSEMKILEAFKVLFAGPDENFASHRSMAEVITKETGVSINPKTLKNIGGMRYEEFMSVVAEGKSAISGVLGKIPLLGPILGFDSDASAEEQAIRKYFENHKDQIDAFKTGDITVDQVLLKIQGEKVEIPGEKEVNEVKEALKNLDTPEGMAMSEELTAEFQKRWGDKNDIQKIIALAKFRKHDVKKAEELFAAREKAYKEFLDSSKPGADPKEVAEKAQKALDFNEQLREEVVKLKDELLYREGWDEAKMLAVSQLPAKIIQWWKLPKLQKEYGIFLWKKYFIEKPKEALDAIARFVKKTPSVELVGREFRTDLKPNEVKEAAAKTKVELDQTRKLVAEADKKIAGLPESDSSRTYWQTQKKMNEEKIKMLEREVGYIDPKTSQPVRGINDYRLEIAQKQEEIARLQSTAGNETKIKLLELQIEENRSRMRSIELERIRIQGDYVGARMTHERMGLVREFGEGADKGGNLMREHFRRMDEMTEMVGAHQRQIERQIGEKLKEMEVLKKEGKDVKAIQLEIERLTGEKIRLNVGSVDVFNNFSKKVTSGWNDIRKGISRGEGAIAEEELRQIMNEESNKCKIYYAKLFGHQIERNLPKTSIAEAVKNIRISTIGGKLLFYGAFIVPAAYMNIDKQMNVDLTKAVEQGALDILPITSTVSDFYSAATGEEIITKRKLDAKDRAIRGLFGFGSALCDVGEVAGTAMKLRRGAQIARGARSIEKDIEIAEALKKATNAGKDVASAEALKEMAHTGRWIHQVAIAGGALAGAYVLISQPLASAELSPEAQQVLGSSVQNIDAKPPEINYKVPGL